MKHRLKFSVNVYLIVSEIPMVAQLKNTFCIDSIGDISESRREVGKLTYSIPL